MAPLWKPEKEIEPEIALKIIQDQFPHLDAKKIAFFGKGWDNSAYLINGEWIFLFPRRKIAVPLLETQMCFLPKIAERLPLPIPNPICGGLPTEEFSWPFLGYKKLSGETACSLDLGDQEREFLVKPIAVFLKILHALPLKLGEKCSLPGDDIGRLHVNRLLEEIPKNLEKLISFGLIKSKEPYLSFLEEARGLPPAKSITLVHGDFYVRHLLLDESRRLCGIIDWGDVHIGDPAVDLAIAHSFLPPSAHKEFRNHYGPIEEETWTLAKLRALHSSALLATYAHDLQDKAILREGLKGLKYQLDGRG